MIFAESGPNDPVAPWLQLIMQAGALGVLLVLAYQIPKLLRTLRDWRDDTETSHRAEREQLRNDHRDALNAQRQDNREAMAAVLKHCDETAARRDRNLESVQGELENLQEIVEGFISGKPRRPKKPPQTHGTDPEPT